MIFLFSSFQEALFCFGQFFLGVRLLMERIDLENYTFFNFKSNLFYHASHDNSVGRAIDV